MAERLPPQNLDAEKSVLGALLLDEDAVVSVLEILKPAHFYSKKHGDIYEAVFSLFERREPLDMITVTNELRKKGRLEDVGGATYLADLVNSVPTSAHAAHHAKIVKECAIKRGLISAASRIQQSVYEEDVEASDLLDQAEQQLFSISRDQVDQDFTPVRGVLEEAFDKLDELHRNPEQLRGVPTGLLSLDDMLAGLQDSDLVILASRPSVGKTSLALNIAQHAAVNEGVPVGFFSLEQSKEQLVYRMLSSQADVDGWRLTTGKLEEDDFERIGRAMGELAEAPIFIDDTPGANIVEMRTKARRLQLEHGVRMIVVDYLQLAHGRGLENRVQEVSEISQAFKNMARELTIPVLTLSQLSRAVESRSDSRPQLSDLRASGCLTGDTRVQMSDGRRVPIEQLAESNELVNVLALDEESWQLEAAPVKKAWCTGEKEVFRLETNLGRTIKASANHKFRTFHGWKPLGELKQGEHIALPRIIKSNIELSSAISDAEASLLGHLLGDGCTLPRHAVQYTTKEKGLADLVCKISQEVFGDSIRPRVKRERTWWQVYLSATEHLTHGKRNPVAEWLDNLGVWGQRSYEKRIPEKMLRQPQNVISCFLRHLWATDGNLGVTGRKNPRAKVYYATSSGGLARDVQHLLLRMGILSRVRRVSQRDKGRDQWHVIITGKEDVMNFVELIGVVGPKSERVDEIQEFYQDRIYNTNRDVIPKEAWYSLVEPAREVVGMSQREMQSYLGKGYHGTAIYKNNLSRKKALQVASIVDSVELEKLSGSDVYWDQVKFVECLGREKVYDLEVKNHHNFVAEDIIVHNSIEQDADVVMFLYRPDPDNRSDVRLFVAKQRNGPTGEVPLYFRGERTRFYEAEDR